MDRTAEKSRGSGKTVLLYAVVCVAFFLAFAILDGPVLEPDSDSYLSMNIMREPLYPLFLALCRRLPGALIAASDWRMGLFPAVILQSLFWAYAVAYTGAAVRGIAAGRKTVAGWAAIGLQLMVCLLNRFASGRMAMYSNHIISEALAMPLWLLFVFRLFYVFRDRKRKDLALCASDALLLLMIRKQMTAALLVWGFMAFVLYLLWKPARSGRRFMTHAALIAGVFLCANLCGRIYNHAVRGMFTPQAGSAEGLLCMLLYTSDEEDSALFREGEEEARAWFTEIARRQTEGKLRMADAPADGGWIARYTHLTQCYDPIGYQVVHAVLQDAIEARGAYAGYDDFIMQMYAAEGELVVPLLRGNLRPYIGLCLVNFIAGLAGTNARIMPQLTAVSFLLYLAYVILWIVCAREAGKREDAARQTGGAVSLFSFLVLCAVVINAAMVALVIYPQPRYTIYSMALFYTAMLLMADYLIERKRRTDAV